MGGEGTGLQEGHNERIEGKKGKGGKKEDLAGRGLNAQSSFLGEKKLEKESRIVGVQYFTCLFDSSYEGRRGRKKAGHTRRS